MCVCVCVLLGRVKSGLFCVFVVFRIAAACVKRVNAVRRRRRSAKQLRRREQHQAPVLARPTHGGSGFASATTLVPDHLGQPANCAAQRPASALGVKSGSGRLNH